MNYRNHDKYQKGIKLMQEKYEQSVIDSVDKGLYEFSPELADLVVSHGMAEVWGEKTSSIALKDKEMLVAAALIAQGGCDEEFEGHIYNSLNIGNSKQQIKEMLILLTLYVGVPKVLAKLPYVQKAFKKFDDSKLNKKEI
ncbi:MAG: carboxymuconolactone decarboxylase family protein [Neisseriaceae bacterium]|nr:MAG: carboxymuconolactone decarboxylase family protein [Neisseriaceae bacterium]